jgi:uncharacterized protein (TIGR03435 family)
MRNQTRRVAVFMLLSVLTLTSNAQVLGQKLAFEVASVKPAARDEQGSEIRTDPGGRLTITNMPLRSIIMYAWQVKRPQIVGSKGWIESQGYTIVAKSDRGTTDAEIRSMLQTLLVDRFRLVLRAEAAEQTVYLLGRVKPGQVGPALIEIDTCAEADVARVQAPSKLPNVACGSFVRGRSWMKGTAVALSNVVDGLSAVVGGIVVDETGLRGRYSVALEWTSTPLPAPPTADTPIAPPVDATGPTLFTALQEQLGLKLQSERRRVEVLVIAEATQPDTD